MATDYYVDSANGSPSSPYTTAASAANDIATVLNDTGGSDPIQPGDRIFVKSTHSHSQGTALTYTFPVNSDDAPVIVISVSDLSTPTTYARGAAETTTSTSTITFGGGDSGAVFIGMDFTSNNDIALANSDSVNMHWIDCKLFLNRAGADQIAAFGVGNVAIFENCTFSFGHASAEFAVDDGGTMIFRDCDGDAGSTAITSNLFNCSATRSPKVFIDGCDFTNILGSGGEFFPSTVEPAFHAVVSNTLIPAGATHFSAAVDPSLIGPVFFYNVGTADIPQIYYEDGTGVVEEDTSVYLTATYDGTNGYSLKMTANAKTVVGQRPLRFVIAEFWAAANPTLDVEFITASTNTANSADLWIEIEYPDATNTAQAKWDRTSRDTNRGLGTPGALTSSSASWTSPPASSTKYKISETITGGGAGVHRVHVCYAPGAAEAIYVDPHVTIS